MWAERKRLLLLIALAAVLAGVLIYLHFRPDEEGSRAVAGPSRRGPASPPRAAKPAAAPRDYRQVLGLARREDASLLPVFREAAGSADWRLRHAGLTGVGKLGKAGDPKLLLAALANKSDRPEVRAVAAEHLGAMKWVHAGPQLIEAMDDDSPVLRAAAGVALRQIMGVHYGFRANAPSEERQQALKLIREQWPSFYAFARSKEK